MGDSRPTYLTLDDIKVYKSSEHKTFTDGVSISKPLLFDMIMNVPESDLQSLMLILQWRPSSWVGAMTAFNRPSITGRRREILQFIIFNSKVVIVWPFQTAHQE